MAWDPSQYLSFTDQRLRPALDLLAAVPLERPDIVVDLGCGPGNVTALLADRWPAARLTGIDNSPQMLARARRDHPKIAFQAADIAAWSPPVPPDVIYSNAALQWLGEHAMLLPRLLRSLAPGGVLAVQMPRNYDAPSHTEMLAVAANGPWAARLAPVVRQCPVAEPAAYYDLLAPLAARLDIWETEYLHVLEGEAPVVAWTSGTALRPLLRPLSEAEAATFLADYTARMARAYPRRPDGRTLMPFRRLFILAVAP